MPTCELSQIAESDIVDLRSMAYRYWEGLMPDALVIQDPERRAVYFDSHFRLGDGQSICWWLVADNARAGFAKVDLWENHDGMGATIRDFFLDHPYRRQGIGQAGAHRIVGALKVRGVHRIDLNVRADNPVALAFWGSVGFELSLYQLRRYI